MTAEGFGMLSPGLIMILGALLVPLLPGVLRRAWVLALPVIAFWQVLGLDHGSFGMVSVFELDLVTLRVDRLSLIFSYIFLIAALLGLIYQLHVGGWLEQTAALIYAGSAVGAVFAGDLITLFLFWEGTAVSSVFLIWAARTERALASGMRYLVVQVGSGVLLLAGALVHYGQTGSIAFDSFELESVAGALIFLSFGIKCAFPLLHNWLQDAYPEATVSGTVILSAFTTKLAVYALVRGFAGTEILVPIGATMAAFPVLYGLIEDDLRRLLAYALNSQLGFMVVGIGVGTELAIDGAVAHAVASVLYKALLFMAIGAVLFRTGSARASDLGGLYRTMPWTTAFCLVGAASIAAFPLLVGFVAKSLILSGAAKEGWFWPWLVLLLVGAGTFLYVGLKLPFFAFFGQDSGLRPREAPPAMLVAMGLTAALCLAIGLFPGEFYALLPHAYGYDPYTVEHVVSQLQILALTAAAFVLLMRLGWFPRPLRSRNLDTDWFWRRPAAWLRRRMADAEATQIGTWIGERTLDRANRATEHFVRSHGLDMIARTRPSSSMAFWMTVMLLAFLVLAFI